MFWNRYLIPLLVIITLVAVLNWLGIAYNFYYMGIGYDVMMHFLGGIAIALLTLWGATFLNVRWLNWLKKPVNLVLFVIFVGFVWEVYEVALGIMFIEDATYFWDTTRDFIMDTLGAVAVVWIANKKK